MYTEKIKKELKISKKIYIKMGGQKELLEKTHKISE
jgi:hypothetical protein